MALNWNIEAVETNLGKEKYDQITSSPYANEEGGEILHPITSALFHYSMSIGLNEIHRDNVKLWTDRIACLQSITGPDLRSEQGSIYITREDVIHHIGLRTNVARMAASTFNAHVMRMAMDDGMREQRKQDRSGYDIMQNMAFDHFLRDPQYYQIINDNAVGYYIAPTREDGMEDSDGKKFRVQCGSGEASEWGVYSFDSKHHSKHLISYYNPDHAVQTARKIQMAAPKRPWQYRDENIGPTKLVTDFVSIAERLTEEIHDDLPDLGSMDAREDDFENHPLAEIREAFVNWSAYSSAENRDPYDDKNTAE